MKFSIVVHASPFESDSARTAYRFAASVLEQGHEIYRLFFFSDGVLNGLPTAGGADNDPSLCECWQQLIRDHDLEAIVCVTSAKKRGLDDTTVADGFVIGGLGQLIDAAVNSERLITFGS